MKLSLTPRVATRDPDLQRELNGHARQVNDLTEGRIGAVHNAATTPPAMGVYQQGDTIRNGVPAELGSPGSKYVVKEFICIVSGSPGTWVECRFLTGN